MAFDLAMAKDRETWRTYMRKVCEETYAQRKRQNLSDESGLLKTYLVEAHQDRALDDSALKEMITEIVKQSQPAHVLPQIKVLPKGDRFFVVQIVGTPLVFDCQQPRFWKIQTDQRSRGSDPLVSRLLQRGSLLDQLWLPSSIQLAIPRASGAEIRYLSTGFGIERSLTRADKIEFRELDQIDAESEAGTNPPQHIQISGPKATDVYDSLVEVSALSSTLGVLRTESRVKTDENEVALSTIWFNGKVTSRGTAFKSLMTTVDLVMSAYAAGIGALEAGRARISGREVLGADTTVWIRSTALSPQQLIESMLAHAERLKLACTWQDYVGDDEGRCDMVDLHTGDSFVLALERTAEGCTLRISLDDNSCVNAVPRLVANLQQFLDARTVCSTFEKAASHSLNQRRS